MRNPEVLSQVADGQSGSDEFCAVFAGKKLKPKEKSAVGILCGPDFKSLSVEQRLSIFGYSQFHELGRDAMIRRKELFGDVREDERDRIVDRMIYDGFLSEKYDEFVKKLNRRRKLGFGMLKLISEGLTPKEALGELDIQFDEEIKGRDNHERFEEFCSRVEVIEHPLLSDKEIAQALGSTLRRVARARKRLRDEGRARMRTRKEISQVRTRERAELRRRIKQYGTKVTNRQIAQKEGISMQQVKHQRNILYRTGEMKKYTRSETKEKLRLILNSFMEQHPFETISLLWVFKEGNLGVSHYTIQSIYHEIAREQTVPPIRKRRSGKKGN